jgi:serine/threonine-protein kinase
VICQSKRGRSFSIMQMCPKCSHDNRDTAKFCNECGTELIGLLGKGEMLHSRYRVTKVLGYGGFGAVYLAEDIQKKNALCAVKVMFDNPNWTVSERAQNIQSFQDEARLLRSLSHPNLPRVFDVFADGGKQYFVMEFVAGQTLEEIVGKSTIGGVMESQVMGWMMQICDALEYLHNNNIIHRDIKPANIRFTPEGQVKLVDFGIAKRFDPSNPKTATMKRAATPGYAPVEQYGGGEHTDARSDIYALGATLYHLLTARRPPDANDRVVQPTIFIPPRKSNPSISANCEQVILKAMAIRPEDRFQKASEMKDTLLGRTHPTFPCPKCQTSNPVGVPVCLACQTPFTGTTMNPFCFRSGKQATTLRELVTLIDGNWTDGIYHFYAGDITNWLGGIGRADLATTARNIIANEKDENIGLEKFLQSLGPDAPPAPKLKVDKTKVNFGNVDVERISKRQYSRMLRITNASRGHLYGTIKSSASWLQVSDNNFSVNNITITARAGSAGRKAEIEIRSNGGNIKIPVEMNPVHTWYKPVLKAGFGGIILFALYQFITYTIFIELFHYSALGSLLVAFQMFVQNMKIGAVMGPMIAIVGAIGCKIYNIGKTPRALKWQKVIWWTLALSGSVLGIITTPILFYIYRGLNLPLLHLVPVYRKDIVGLMIVASIRGGIIGLLIGSSIGFLKWLRKIRKPLMYPVVIGGLLFILLLLWAIGDTI